MTLDLLATLARLDASQSPGARAHAALLRWRYGYLLAAIGVST